jgi:hypothetical protein
MRNCGRIWTVRTERPCSDLPGNCRAVEGTTGLCGGNAARAALLLLDEPSANLDEAGRELLAGVLAEQRQRGLALLATNDVRDFSVCDERIELMISLRRCSNQADISLENCNDHPIGSRSLCASIIKGTSSKCFMILLLFGHFCLRGRTMAGCRMVCGAVLSFAPAPRRRGFRRQRAVGFAVGLSLYLRMVPQAPREVSELASALLKPHGFVPRLLGVGGVAAARDGRRCMRFPRCAAGAASRLTSPIC